MVETGYKPPLHPLVRVVAGQGRQLLVLGHPAGATFDVTPAQAIRLGLVIMETALHLKALEKLNNPQGEAMSITTTEEGVRAIVVEHLGVQPAKATLEARFIEDLGADSLDRLELIMAVEERFGIVITDDQAGKFETVGDLVAFATAAIN